MNWVLDTDSRGLFDNVSHGWTMKFIEHRVADRRMLSLIQKWLQAGSTCGLRPGVIQSHAAT